MNELMKLADAFAEYKDHSEYVHSRAALQSAIEALQAENERLKDKLDSSVHGHNQIFELCKVLEAERDALAAKLVPLEADAERYRWLRNKARSVDWSRNYEGTSSYSLFCRNSPELMDRQIDAAIDAAKGGQHEDA